MKQIALMAGALLVVACGGSDSGDNADPGPSAPTGPCVAREGTFRLTYTQQSGDCGPVSDSVVNIGGASGGTSTSTCHGGTQSVSSDNCTITTTRVVCTSAGSSVQATGKVTWAANGSSATGTTQMIISDAATGKEVCNSVYGMKYTKI